MENPYGQFFKLLQLLYQSRKNSFKYLRYTTKWLITSWKVSKYGSFSGPYFPVFELNTEIYSVIYEKKLHIPDQKKLRIWKLSHSECFTSDTIEYSTGLVHFHSDLFNLQRSFWELELFLTSTSTHSGVWDKNIITNCGIPEGIISKQITPTIIIWHIPSPMIGYISFAHVTSIHFSILTLDLLERKAQQHFILSKRYVSSLILMALAANKN